MASYVELNTIGALLPPRGSSGKAAQPHPEGSVDADSCTGDASAVTPAGLLDETEDGLAAEETATSPTDLSGSGDSLEDSDGANAGKGHLSKHNTLGRDPISSIFDSCQPFFVSFRQKLEAATVAMPLSPPRCLVPAPCSWAGRC